MTESENSVCDLFLAPRSVDGILDFSMDPVLLAAFRLDTDFNRDSSTDPVFSTAVQGGNATQTAFRPRAVATTYKLHHNEGARIGGLPASLLQSRPESTYNTRQPTARIARRIVCHAAISAVEALPVLTTAAPAPAALTTAAPASAVLTTTSVRGSVVAWSPGIASDASAFFCRSSPHHRPSNLAPAPLRHTLRQASPGAAELLQQKLQQHALQSTSPGAAQQLQLQLQQQALPGAAQKARQQQQALLQASLGAAPHQALHQPWPGGAQQLQLQLQQQALPGAAQELRQLQLQQQALPGAAQELRQQQQQHQALSGVAQELLQLQLQQQALPGAALELWQQQQQQQALMQASLGAGQQLSLIHI